jgi:uncharacterized protein (UPF0216 family)
LFQEVTKSTKRPIKAVETEESKLIKRYFQFEISLLGTSTIILGKKLLLPLRKFPIGIPIGNQNSKIPTKTKQRREVLQSTEKQTINNNLFENYVLRPVLM